MKNAFYSTMKILTLRFLSFCPDSFYHVGKCFGKKPKAN